jgi:glycosyltransferase involved in cell wall biosynthesis
MGEFEVIVVIDGSTDNTISVLKNFTSLFKDFTIIEQENKGRASVRNRGVQAAKSDILVFFDDDMEPFSDCVERHFNFQQTHQDAILCGYPVEEQSPDKTDIQNYKAMLSKKWTSAFPEDLHRLSPDSMFLTAATMSTHKKTFDTIGGFDERLTDIEDLEFAKRASEKKIQVYFDKANRAFHHDPITCGGYIKRIRQYTRAQQYLHQLYPAKFPDRKVKSFAKKAFYSLFSFSIYPRLIDDTRIMELLPTVVRYKIYDWVIYSLGVVFSKKELN